MNTKSNKQHMLNYHRQLLVEHIPNLIGHLTNISYPNEVIDCLLLWAMDNCFKKDIGSFKKVYEERIRRYPKVDGIVIASGKLSMTDGWCLYQFPNAESVSELHKATVLNMGFQWQPKPIYGYLKPCTKMDDFNLYYKKLNEVKV